MRYIRLSSSASDITGSRFGRLTAVGPVGKTKQQSVVWQCRCDCGTVKDIDGQNLRYGRILSCGCLNSEMSRERGKNKRTHGMAKSTEHKIWQGIWQRCANPFDKSFHRYGGRGISVCERWSSFEAFYADMGPRPSRKHSIDRIDNDGNYEPGNCRWATFAEQNRNRSTTLIVDAMGKSGCLADFFVSSHSKEYQRARKMIAKGFDPAMAIKTVLGVRDAAV